MSSRRAKNLLCLFLACFAWPTFLYFSLYRGLEDPATSGRVEQEKYTFAAEEPLSNIALTEKNLSSIYHDYKVASLNEQLTILDSFFKVAQLQHISQSTLSDLEIKKQAIGGISKNSVIFGLKEIADSLPLGEHFIYLVDDLQADENSYFYTLNISNTSAELTRSISNRGELERQVEALRCGLDVREWHINQAVCKEEYPGVPDSVTLGALPFNIELSHAIYNNVFGAMSIDSKSSQLHVVSTGPIVVLPLNILVTRVGQTFADTEWFVDRFSHSLNASVQGYIDSESNVQRNQQARKKMRFLGIGNPNIEGDEASIFYTSNLKKAARMSRAFTSCTTGKILGFGNVGHFISDYHRDSEIEIDKEGIANPDSIRRLTPLPESAYEICSVSERFKTIKKRMLLSRHARERKIKEMNEDGKLAEYDVIHIASHAIVDRSGRSSGTGIVLSPHDKPSLNDDGFLNLKEISELKLDADWVILSACNTGTSAKNAKKLLGGLVEAFSRAHVRSLLVTNWSVSSQAAMEITTNTVERFTNSMQTKQSALRETILELKQGSGTRSHPAYWGPFTLIGS